MLSFVQMLCCPSHLSFTCCQLQLTICILSCSYTSWPLRKIGQKYPCVWPCFDSSVSWPEITCCVVLQSCIVATERLLCVLLVLPHSGIVFSPRCVPNTGIVLCCCPCCVDCHDKVGGTRFPSVSCNVITTDLEAGH